MKRPTHEELRRRLRHRDVGAALLAGEGLEVGALHFPQRIPGARSVDYVDVEDVPALRARFPELRDERLVAPRWVGDLGRRTVPAITGRRFHFVVMNHVLEHVANPIQVLAHAWEGLVDGGHLVLSVPDKRFTFDRERALTPFDHLLEEYARGVTTVTADHFLDLVSSTDPDAWDEPYGLLAALDAAVVRREHVHVWDSDAFRGFWQRTARLLGLGAEILFESGGDDNAFEYFAVVARAPTDEHRRRDALRMLAGVWRQRADLQRAFPAADSAMPRGLLAWATTSGATIDSDAPALARFQPEYRRLLAAAAGDGAAGETRLGATPG